MHLWTEYEGRTIAEHYTLGKLLRSEGRNGFFATADKNGHPAVIRLTEAHFDESELLSRWRQVAEVHQDNLIEIEQVGQTTFEGVALTYALMEPDDANLGDVLKERPLTTAETLQVAKAVLAAVQALHASGLVHEHIEPSNILAVGETVKLRSDCVRECIPDGEFSTEETCAELRKKDLHDFGTTLLRCLTLETEWAPAHNNLPEPFKRLIPRALDGSWSLEQLGALLEPVAPAFSTSRSASTLPGAAQRPAPAAERDTALNKTAAAPGISPVAPPMENGSAVKGPLIPAGVRKDVAPEGLASSEEGSVSRHSAELREGAVPVRIPRTDRFAEPAETPSRLIWAVLAGVALLVLWLGWHFFFSNSSGTQSSKPTSSATVSTPATRAPSPAREMPVRTASPVVQSPTSQAAADAPAHAGAPGWYVIAFTYNHEDQAASKVRHLRRNHDSLHPQVFSPTGHAPYLVSLGGSMASQDEAEAVYRHARRAGLPRDTFVRHY